MAIRANVSIEGFRLDRAYCRIATAEIRRAGDGLHCDCVVDILSSADAGAPIQKRVFRNIPVTDDGQRGGLRRQIYGALKRIEMFADPEDV